LPVFCRMPVKVLNRADLPQLGLPAIATVSEFAAEVLTSLVFVFFESAQQPITD